jgi:hypothetical protein
VRECRWKSVEPTKSAKATNALTTITAELFEMDENKQTINEVAWHRVMSSKEKHIL